MKNSLLLCISFLLAFQAGAAQVSIVLDDFGYPGYPAHKIFLMNYPFTLAILPFSPNATRFALQARKAGFEIILHLPLEALSEIPADNSTYLTVEMPPDRVERVIIDNMLRLPGIVGVNNHQGSLFTEDLERMTVLLKTLGNYNLFFMDSLTSPHSICKEAARKEGVKILKRDVFLDNTAEEENIRKQLQELFCKAEKNGSAIGIGHARAKTLDYLEKLLPEILDEYPDIQIVPLSRIYQDSKRF
ncbi:MAG: divergent polysaccharide deacetylase family protein [Candidatus Wallbacteria bacterium]|nr:divergent polysaccharide deacetylase family protein [Candidatus Wallbacteria bacterium]